MTTKTKTGMVLMLMAILTGCSKDDDLQSDPNSSVPVEVEFGPDTYVTENGSEWDMTIEFSKPAIKTGTITLDVITETGDAFSTIPAVTDNKIVIQVAKGAESASFKIDPQDDWFIDGHKLITFQLKAVTAGFKPGTKTDLLVDLYDDELWHKPKSWLTVAGEKRSKRTLEYMQDGKVSKVHWEEIEGEAERAGTFTYEYDAHNRLKRVVNSNGNMEIYTWHEDRLTQSDIVEDGVLTVNKGYNYDGLGRIIQIYIHERDASGSYPLKKIFTYDYHDNGNLNKKKLFQFVDHVTWLPLEVRTYESYLEKENPVQLEEIVPTFVSQPQLPHLFRAEVNGEEFPFTYAYEYNQIGLPTKRTTTGEEITYSYY